MRIFVLTGPLFKRSFQPVVLRARFIYDTQNQVKTVGSMLWPNCFYLTQSNSALTFMLHHY